MRLRGILFNYQNKYLQAGVAASVFRQGEKLSPSWALIASRHQDQELILRDPSPAHVISSPASLEVTIFMISGMIHWQDHLRSFFLAPR